MRVLDNFLETHLKTKKQIRIALLSITALLFVIGLVFLSSAYLAESRSVLEDPNIIGGLIIQISAFVVGGVALFVTSTIRYQYYREHINKLFIATIILMALLISPLGIEANNAVRWLDLGFIQFQPSEIMKIVTIMLAASVFAQKDFWKNKDIIRFGGFAIVAVLVASIAQPDYGTFVVIASSVLLMLLITTQVPIWLRVGIPTVIIIGIMMLGLIGPLYVQERVDTFYLIYFGELTQEQRYGSAYHALQNLHAVQFGGLTGQGLGFVSKNTSLQIPELSTDSIFALIAAEGGFLISSTVVTLFALLFFLMNYIAAQARTRFGRLLVVGLSSMFGIQVLINMLVVLGIPATGIPLLFFSRGGTSLVITLATIGIMLNVLRDKKEEGKRLYRKTVI